LRVIEEALSEEDPELSLLMAGPLDADERLRLVSRRAFWIYLVVTLVVFVFGLVVEDVGILGYGILMLTVTPAVVPCAVEIVRRWL
jgi:hypothetical protein